jgi:hypothetical protein
VLFNFRKKASLGMALTLTFCAGLAEAQLIGTKMQPDAAAAFDRYIKDVEVKLKNQWPQPTPAGPPQITGGDSVPVHGGLIHDWTGTVFIPGVSVNDVLKVLQGFDHHSEYYPTIISSRLISRQGNHLVGHWRLSQRKQMIPLVLDIDQDEQYEQLSTGKWICISHGKNIAEIENAGSSDEKRLPPGEGQGIIWRWNGYWALMAVDDGVLAQCRSISLSRGIPMGLTWMVKPLLENFSRDALTATLKETRDASIGINGRKESK